MKAISTAILLLFSLGLSAQNPASETENPHQLGLNATFMVQLLLGDNDLLDDRTVIREVLPMFTYKYLPGRTGLRSGWSGNYRRVKDNPSDDLERTAIDYWFDTRIGVERHFPIGDKWSVFAGLDGIFEYSYSNTKTVFDDQFTGTEETTELNITGETFGGGPVMGVQFFINDRISLFTESTIYFRDTTTNTKSTNSNNPDFDDEQSSNDSDVEFSLPTALFLAIRF